MGRAPPEAGEGARAATPRLEVPGLPVVVLALVAAARRTTPEHRTQRPHHFRQAPPLRAAGRHYTRTRDVGRSAAHVTAGSPVRAQPSARRERNPPRARAPSLRRRTQAERTVPAPAQWPAAPTQALLPPALGSAGIPSPGQPRREPRPYLPAAARVPVRRAHARAPITPTFCGSPRRPRLPSKPRGASPAWALSPARSSRAMKD